MSINWGSLQQGGGFQNALAMGMQMGQFARQRQDEKEYKNALATVLMPQGGTSGGQAPGMGGMGGGIVATPEQKAQSEAMRAQFPNAPEYAPDNERAEAMRVIAQRNPQLFTQMQGQAAAQRAAAQEADLTAQALSTDPAVRGPALQQLARVNFPKFQALDKRQQDAIAAESKMFGEAALNLSQIPYEQRRDMIIAYAQEMPQFADKINEIAFLPQAEQDRILQVAITNAGLVQEMIKLNEPRYQAIPEGGTLVNTRDPGAVQQFQQGGGAQGGFVEGQTATNPQTGQRIVFSNGAWRPM